MISFLVTNGLDEAIFALRLFDTGWERLGAKGLKLITKTKNKKRTNMARYIALLKLTEQGAQNIKKSTARAHQFDKQAEKAGVTIEGQYWTIGHYDGVLILKADDEGKALHWLAELAALGNVRTETLQAFVDNEFERIVGTK